MANALELNEQQVKHLVAAMLAAGMAGGVIISAEQAVANYKQVRQILKHQGLAAPA